MIHRATPADHDTVVAILARAFTDDPIVSWLFPDPTTRAHLQTELYYAPLLTHPSVETDLVAEAGAAIWLRLATGQPPYGDGPTSPPYRNEPAELPAAAHRLQALGEALAQRHPHDQPYLYLPCMGVAAAHRGAGIGSTMLRDRLRYADSLAIGTYLEASSPRSRALYLRHGFRDQGSPVQVADSPTLWPMWRPTTGDKR
ncbi:GNAT family N-acetyltransferase [Kribbella kalugense]|uniref:Acetyltransferase (GNAT) family protein n=1 Tax=Kribbella kalugense TaxID=2512221 RepID=A0A4R8A2U1_9ACTN|nr:GNAT family N-acetyltransferase [Kribbella kalugense]TDW22490.1 acetyltransferase (GNAT) family protein [Kribbella kalugense]